MRRGLLALALASASACAGLNIGTISDCPTLCAQAAACGILPSALGWSEEGDATAAEADCVQRCENSAGDEAEAVAACLRSEAGTESWCEDPESVNHADWAACAAIDACLGKTLGWSALHLDVKIEVQFLGLTDYTSFFETDAVALYGEASMDPDASLASCTRAPCGREQCREMVCGDEACEEPEETTCDTTLCRVAAVSITQACQELGVQAITVRVREGRRPPVIQVFHDGEAGINDSCESSSLAIEGEMYKLRPGPLEISARVVGEMAVSVLEELGAPGLDPSLADTDLAPYCLEFVGPTVVARVGANMMSVPLPDLEELLELNAALAAEGMTLRFCDT